MKPSSTSLLFIINFFNKLKKDKSYSKFENLPWTFFEWNWDSNLDLSQMESKDVDSQPFQQHIYYSLNLFIFVCVDILTLTNIINNAILVSCNLYDKKLHSDASFRW